MTEPTQASPARATVTMFVVNDVVHDARVRRRPPRSARRATTYAHRPSAPADAAARERLNGFTLLRVPPQNGTRSRPRPVGHGWCAARSSARSASPSRGPPAAGSGQPPWSWRAARRTVGRVPGRRRLPPRRPRPDSPSRGGTVDWLARWQFDIKGWGEAAARAAPRSDVWHGHDFTGLPAAFAAQRLHGGKVVYDSHEIYMETTRMVRLPGWARWRLAREERDWTRRADALIAVSEGSRAEIAGATGPSAACGSPTARHAGPAATAGPAPGGTGLPPGTPIVLYHGGFMEGRGIELLATRCWNRRWPTSMGSSWAMANCARRSRAGRATRATAGGSTCWTRYRSRSCCRG